MLTQSIIGTALSWAGIMAGALTVFSNLEALTRLSDWSRWVASHWHEWMTVLWGSYLGLANVTTDPDIVLVDVPFLASLVLIAIASRFVNDDAAVASMRRAFYSLLSGAAVLFAIYAIVIILWNSGYAPAESVTGVAFLFAGFWLVMFLMVSHWPYYLAVASASAAIILFVLLLAGRGEPTSSTEIPYAFLAGEFLLVIAATSLVVFVAKPAPFTRHLWMLVLCVMTLAGLNAISDFHFDLAPPTSAMLFSVASS